MAPIGQSGGGLSPGDLRPRGDDTDPLMNDAIGVAVMAWRREEAWPHIVIYRARAFVVYASGPAAEVSVADTIDAFNAGWITQADIQLTRVGKTYAFTAEGRRAAWRYLGAVTRPGRARQP